MAVGYSLVYVKGHTPREQVAQALGEFKEEDFQQGVPFDKIAAKVHFQQDDWDEGSLHNSIGQLLDSKKYVVERVTADGSKHSLVYAKGHTPREQVARALGEFKVGRTLKQGVPLSKIAEKVHFQQDDWNEHALHNSISHLLDGKKYVVERVTVDGSKHSLVYVKGHTPREQVARALGEFSNEDYQQGVPFDKIAAKVHFQQDDWDEGSLHNSIGQLLDSKKYVTEQRDDKTFVHLKSREQ